MECRDHRLFADFMKLRGESVRTLAEKTGCSRSTIGHLRSGHIKRTNPDRARAIAAALNAPVESLFVPSVSRVSQDAA